MFHASYVWSKCDSWFVSSCKTCFQNSSPIVNYYRLIHRAEFTEEILLCLQNVGRIASKSSEPLILYSRSFTWCRNNANAPKFSDKVQCKKLNHKKQDDVSWKLSIGPTYVTIYLSWVIYHAWSLLNQTRSNKVFAFEIVPVPYKPDAVKRTLVISVSEYSSGLLFTSWFTKSGCNGVW